MEDTLLEWVITNNPLKLEHTMQTYSGELVPPKLWIKKYHECNGNVCSVKDRENFLKEFCTMIWPTLISKKF